jgi:hypothetical protein
MLKHRPVIEPYAREKGAHESSERYERKKIRHEGSQEREHEAIRNTAPRIATLLERRTHQYKENKGSEREADKLARY